MSMSKPGVGNSLRTPKLEQLLDPSIQTPIANKPFDPIAADCAIVESFSTWCGPCIKLIPKLMQFALKYKNIKVLQISPETPEKLKAFFSGVKVPYSVSAIPKDVENTWGDFYNITGIPHLVLLRHGVAVFSGHPLDPALEPLLIQLNAEIQAEKANIDTTTTTTETTTATTTATTTTTVE